MYLHSLYRVLIMTVLSEHAVDFVFSGEKVFIVASPVNLQNDHDYALSNAKKRNIAPKCLLRCRAA